MAQSSSERLVDELKMWISAAPAGARLPSTRSLIADHGVSPVTVQKALRSLVAQGMIEAQPGVGTFVRAKLRARPHDYAWQTAALGSLPGGAPRVAAALRTAANDVIALQAGYPDRDLLPDRLVRSALARAARGENAFARPPIGGIPELQAWFADDLASATGSGGNRPHPSDVIVIPGSQSGLSTLFRTLVGPGRPLLIESPSYWGAILAAAQVGVELVPIPSGAGGPDPHELDRALARTGARAFYAQPNFANPTGAQWSPALAETVLAVVRDRGAFLIEDDWAHDLAISSDPRPLAAADEDGHVVYLRSLTKSVAPSIRVAGMIVRGPARERVLADTQTQSMYVSGVLQAAALDVITHPGWHSHLRSLRGRLATRRDLLVAALREHAPSAHVTAVPRGGLHLWLQLPDETGVRQLVRECEACGVVVAPGDEWFPAEATGKFLRLSYAGADPGALPNAARTLGRCLESQ